MKKIIAAIAVLVLALTFVIGGVASAASVEPVLVTGNPSAADLGFDFGFKEDTGGTGSAGTYVIDGINTVTITTADGVYFDWTSTLGIDAVDSRRTHLAQPGFNLNPTSPKSMPGLRLPFFICNPIRKTSYTG